MSTVSEAQTQLDLINQTKNPSKAEAGSQKLSEDFDNFLLLLTTQLQNQDPTEPLDVNQFTNQLVLFSGVEQQITTNENLEKLINFQTSSQLTGAVGYIGKVVDTKGNAGELVDGVAGFSYELDTTAATSTVLITDGAGRAVFSGQGTTFKGKNLVSWDGTNAFTGAKEPDGTYFINVLAKDATGNTVTSRTMTTGRVTGAEMQDGEMVLTVAGTYVKLADVKAVRDDPRIVSAANDNGGSTTDPDDTQETGGTGNTSADDDASEDTE